MGYEVIHGDSAEVLKTFADSSIDAVVCDPPHGLFFMGSQWDAELPAQAIWDECFRVLKPGGHVFVMSSERLGCVAGLYMSLRKAGFEVDETQLLNWVSLTGMPKSVDVGKVADKEAFRAWLTMHREFVPCPDHKEPKDPVTGEKQRCVECERIFCEGNLTHHDKRKAESAAVNGQSPEEFITPDGKRAVHGGKNFGSDEPRVTDATEHLSLLTRLLASHWPTSPAEQRAHWEACVAEVPEDWDCSRPPGVRVKTGTSNTRVPKQSTDYGAYGFAKEGVREAQACDEERAAYITAPSTPDACALEGRRASVAPLKPFCYPIIHAQKPCEGSYLANWRKWGTGPVGVGGARIPYLNEDDRAGWHDTEGPINAVGIALEGSVSGYFNKGAGKRTEAGRTPANLLSYGDLLGDLQRYADLSAWCEALGLPEAAAELLEAGLGEEHPEQQLDHYRQSLINGSGKLRNGTGLVTPQRNTHPTSKPTALCAYLVTLATAPGQTVLDPFCGSGSTGVACALIGRRFIGIELDSEDKGFCAIARARIAHAQDRAAPAAQAPLLEVS